MAVMDEDEKRTNYKIVKKLPKAHSRGIIRARFVRNPQNSLHLITCAHDSMKVWRISFPQSSQECMENSISFIMKEEVKGWRCGAQDFDVTPDGQVAAVVGVESTLHQVSFPSVGLPVLESFNIGYMEIWHVCIMPNRLHYLTVSFSGALTTLDMKGKIIKQVPLQGVRQVSSFVLSANGNLIAIANNEGVVVIFEASTLEKTLVFEAHAVKVRAMCFSPDSSQLITGSDDKILKLHDLSSTEAKLLKSFCGHRSNITAVHYDRYPDGLRFASGSSDGTVILWNISPGHILHCFKNIHDGAVSDLAFSPNNQFIVSVGDDRMICFYAVSDDERNIIDPDDEFAIDTDKINIPALSSMQGGNFDYFDTAEYQDHASFNEQKMPVTSPSRTDQSESGKQLIVDNDVAQVKRDLEDSSDDENSRQ